MQDKKKYASRFLCALVFAASVEEKSNGYVFDDDDDDDDDEPSLFIIFVKCVSQ